MVWFIHDIDPIQAQYECKSHGIRQSVITAVLIIKLGKNNFPNNHPSNVGQTGLGISLSSAKVHRVHRVAVAQRGGIAGARPTQQRGTNQPLGG